MKELNASSISSLCMQLQLLVQSGTSVAEAFDVLAQEEPDNTMKAYLIRIEQQLESGASLCAALKAEGGFPSYAVHMIDLGEKTGKLDITLRELSSYYAGRSELSQTIRNAVIYPSVLLIMVLFVVVILVVKVLPIFNDVFAQLGSTMTGFAAAAMHIGAWINQNALIVIAAIAVIAALILLFALTPGLRRKFTLSPRSGKLAGKMARERFSAAMSMAVSSGMDIDEALEMADQLADNAEISRQIAVCKQEMAQGTGFAKSIAKAGIFSPLCCRLLEIGIRTGSTDTVMAEIARRYHAEVEDDISAAVRKIEPTLVIIMSVIVGVILLSVMLPLMGIMSSLL